MYSKSLRCQSVGLLPDHFFITPKSLNEAAGIGSSVLHMATIKPLDAAALEEFATNHDVLVTVEEHQINGGLGGAVAEHLSEVHPIKIKRIGVQDQFGQSGEPEQLVAHYKMDIDSIVNAAQELLK